MYPCYIEPIEDIFIGEALPKQFLILMGILFLVLFFKHSGDSVLFAPSTPHFTSDGYSVLDIVFLLMVLRQGLLSKKTEMCNDNKVSHLITWLEEPQLCLY